MKYLLYLEVERLTLTHRQYDAHVKTIEGTLFKARVKAGAVSQDNSDDPVKVC